MIALASSRRLSIRLTAAVLKKDTLVHTQLFLNEEIGRTRRPYPYSAGGL